MTSLHDPTEHPDPGLLWRGFLLWPAKHWLTLPQPWTMLVSHAGSEAALITTHAAAYETARRHGWPVLTGLDWLALARAAEAGRSALAIEQWLMPDVWTGDDPWRLRPQSLAACLGDRANERISAASLGDITTQDVFAHFGCELKAIDPT